MQLTAPLVLPIHGEVSPKATEGLGCSWPGHWSSPFMGRCRRRRRRGLDAADRALDPPHPWGDVAAGDGGASMQL